MSWFAQRAHMTNRGSSHNKKNKKKKINRNYETNLFIPSDISIYKYFVLHISFFLLRQDFFSVNAKEKKRARARNRVSIFWRRKTELSFLLIILINSLLELSLNFLFCHFLCLWLFQQHLAKDHFIGASFLVVVVALLN
jgi:hypothetical protein